MTSEIQKISKRLTANDPQSVGSYVLQGFKDFSNDFHRKLENTYETDGISMNNALPYTTIWFPSDLGDMTLEIKLKSLTSIEVNLKSDVMPAPLIKKEFPTTITSKELYQLVRRTIEGDNL